MGFRAATILIGRPNGSRLSCGALKKKSSFNIPTRAASFKRLLGRRPCDCPEALRRHYHGPCTRRLAQAHCRGNTVKRVYIPARKCPGMWQCSNHRPGLSGRMSATADIIGVNMIMSVRMCPTTAVCPCQCTV